MPDYLQVTGTNVTPINTQAQTMLYLALLGLFGSQRIFLFNRIGAVWAGVKSSAQSTDQSEEASFPVHYGMRKGIQHLNALNDADSTPSMDTVRLAIYTYTTARIGSMNEVCHFECDQRAAVYSVVLWHLAS